MDKEWEDKLQRQKVSQMADRDREIQLEREKWEDKLNQQATKF